MVPSRPVRESQSSQTFPHHSPPEIETSEFPPIGTPSRRPVESGSLNAARSYRLSLEDSCLLCRLREIRGTGSALNADRSEERRVGQEGRVGVWAERDT